MAEERHIGSGEQLQAETTRVNARATEDVVLIRERLTSSLLIGDHAPVSTGPGDAPLRLRLQFIRAQDAGERYDFQFVPQDYILQSADGESPTARFDWTGAALADLHAMRCPDRDPSVLRRLGERLRRFVRNVGWDTCEQEIERALAKQRAVFLTICSSAAELYALPWELLTLKSGRAIGRVDNLLLRYEWPGGPSQEEQPKPRLEGGRILVAWSAAGGAVPAVEHIQALQAACISGFYPFDWDGDVLANASLPRIAERLAAARDRGAPIDILHLLCHGAPVAGTFGLCLDGSSGPVVVDAAQVQEQLAPFASMVRLVVLSACDAGNPGPLGNHLGSVAQELHRAGFQSVLASRYPLSVAGSILLTESFYRDLLSGPASLESALLSARKRLALEETDLPAGQGRLDWASLQLCAREQDGDDTRPLVIRPYRGLLAFQPEHRRFFFGRDAEISETLNGLQSLEAQKKARFLIVAGASGTGKSSLVLAGAVPKLLSAHPQLAFLRMCPGRNPEQALQDALRLRPIGQSALLVVDQFEELFTQTESPAAREAFVRRLWTLASDPEPGLWVVLTLRVDFIGRCGELVLDATGRRLDEVAYAEEYRVFVAQMKPKQLAAAMEEPARKVGLQLEPGLVDRMLHDVGAEPGALPLLEDALDVLWRQRSGRTLTQRAYDTLGGVVGALQKRADGLFDRLSQPEQALARLLLLHLVSVADDTALDTRRRVPLAELEGALAATDRPLFERVLHAFVTERLLVQNIEAPQNAATVEVAHEALIRKWPRLRAWLDEDRAGLLVQRRIRGAAQQWASSQDDGSLLYHGTQLAQANDWRLAWRFRLGNLEQRFLDASQALETRKKREAQEQLDRERQLAEENRQKLLDTYIERGHQLLFTEGKPMHALLWLHRAYAEGSKDSALPSLLAEATLPLDAVLLTLSGHSGVVHRASYSPDGQRIVTASADGTAKVWDAHSGRCLRTLESRNKEGLWSARFSPDGSQVLTRGTADIVEVWEADSGKYVLDLEGEPRSEFSAQYNPDGSCIIVAGGDDVARIWDVRSGKCLQELKGHQGPVVCAQYSPDGSSVLSAGLIDGTAKVWDSHSGELLYDIGGHPNGVRSADYSLDGAYIVTTHADAIAKVWDAHRGQWLHDLTGHSDVIAHVEFSPDGRSIVTISQVGDAKVWDAHSGRCLYDLDGQRSPIRRAHYSPDANRIVAASDDGVVKTWDARNGNYLRGHYGHQRNVESAQFSPDGSCILSVGTDGTAKVWDARGGRCLHRLEIHQDGGHVRGVQCSPDGSCVVTAGADGIARVWDISGGKLLYDLEGHRGQVACSCYSPDGSRLVTADDEGIAKVWDARSGEWLHDLEGHRSQVFSAQYSPDGNRIVTAGIDGTAKVWDAHSGRCLHNLEGHQDDVASAGFSPDGSRIVTASLDGSARIWDAERGECLHNLAEHPGPVWSAQFSPDGACIITLSDECTAIIWDVCDGQWLHTLDGHQGQLCSAQYSPDGRRIVTTSEDGTAIVWDALMGSRLYDLEGHQSCVLIAQFSRDGGRIVTASGDKIAKVWDALSGRRLHDLVGHDAGVESAQFSPDGSHVVTASADGTARIWDVRPERRSPEQIGAWMRRHLPYKLEGSVIVPTQPEGGARESMFAPEPRPPSWDQRLSQLWSGVYAWQRGDLRTAHARLAGAQAQLQAWADPEGLASVLLAQRVVQGSPMGEADRQTLTALLCQAHAAPEKRAAAFFQLAELALDELYAQDTASWAVESGLRLSPEHPRGLLIQCRVQLQVGRFHAVLEQAARVFAACGRDFVQRTRLASYAFCAAQRVGSRRDQASCAQELLDSYATIEEGRRDHFKLDLPKGLRHALYKGELRDLPVDAICKLFAILGETKSEEAFEQLARHLNRMLDAAFSQTTPDRPSLLGETEGG